MMMKADDSVMLAFCVLQRLFIFEYTT